MRTRALLPPIAALGAAVLGACHTAPAPAALAPAAPASEAMLLRLRYRAGDAFRSQIVVDVYLHLGPGEAPSGDSVQPMVHVTQFVTESVTAVSGDTFTVAFIADSSRVTTPGINLPAASLDSLRQRGLMMTMRLSSRSRILSTQMERTAQIGTEMATLRMMLPGADTLPEAGRGMATLLPDLPVRAGDAWADTTACPGILRGCEGGIVTRYRLERVKAGGKGRVAVISSRAEMPATTVKDPMEFTVGPMHVVTDSRFDPDAGRFTAHSMTVSGVAHSPMGDMSMRMEMRQTPLPAAPPSGAAGPAAPPAPLAPPPMPPGFLIRRGGPPAPATLDAMIATFRESEPSLSLASCVLPEVAPAADWPLLATPDSGFRVRLPPGWQMRMGDSSFGEPRTVLENDAGSRIRVARSLHASGRETLNMASSFGRPVELSHTGPCQMGTGPSGSVWTFYAPDSAAAPLPRYMALGALITAGGRAYRITVGAATAQERDRLVRIAADAARP